MSAPNIILICVDQWRGDCLSAAGHPHVRTPHLDQLASGGTRFSAAYSATPTCVPARVAFFTGQSQERHGRVGYVEGVPFEEAHPVTLAGELRKGGYQTQAIGKMHVWPERARAGFDDVVLHDGFLGFARRQGGRDVAYYDDYVPWLRRQPGASPDEDHVDHGVSCNSVVARPWDKPEHLHPTSWVGTQTKEWLYRRDPTRPFFLYLSFHRPHPPYDPPAWAFDDYLDLPPYEPVVGDWVDDYAAYGADGDHEAFVGRMDPRSLHRARAGYYGHMSHIDLQINRIRTVLADFGLDDDTIVCFTSDHGEMLGEHHMFRKGFGFEGSARVPLLFGSLPEGFASSNVVDEPVELRDVMPTLLDLAGLPVPEECDGRSLVPLLRGEEADDWRPLIHGEHVLLGQSLQWVTDGRTKYLWMSGDGHEQLFDLGADPHEEHNLAHDPASRDLLETWRGHLAEALEGREEGFVSGGRLVTGRPVVNILRHTRERLAAAGTA
ncbi:arylsulfatase [Isoptericola hypogeus]|uniref:Arylsulfatase n=1 Tax=Isoptericola hypogeus TaxID=300179 RepID=A0ABN2J649_9MICO